MKCKGREDDGVQVSIMHVGVQVSNRMYILSRRNIYCRKTMIVNGQEHRATN